MSPLLGMPLTLPGRRYVYPSFGARIPPGCPGTGQSKSLIRLIIWVPARPYTRRRPMRYKERGVRRPFTPPRKHACSKEEEPEVLALMQSTSTLIYPSEAEGKRLQTRCEERSTRTCSLHLLQRAYLRESVRRGAKYVTHSHLTLGS